MVVAFKKYSALLLLPLLVTACGTSKKTHRENERVAKAVHGEDIPKYIYKPNSPVTTLANTNTVKVFEKPLRINRNDFVAYAQQFIGVPYRYGGNDPETGFDCSGFVCHVFKKYNVAAPRTSVTYTNAGRDVALENAKPADLILFSTRSNPNVVGHIGIVVSNQSGLITFVHAATSKNIGVILSELKGYYQTHFVKVIRVME